MSSYCKIFVILISILWIGCDDGSFATSGEVEQKYVNPAFNGQNAQKKEPLIPTFRARYSFVSKLKVLKAKVCDGTAILTVYSDMSDQMSGTVPCTGGRDIDLSEMRGQSIEAPDEIARNLPLYGFFKRVAGSGTATYDPPIPEMISPIVNVPQHFVGKYSDEKLKISRKTSTGIVESYEGRVITKVESVEDYKPEQYSKTLKNVIHFTRVLEGFDDKVNYGEFGLYREVQYWIQPRPFVIAKILLRGKVKDFASEPAPEQSEEDFTSKLGLNLDINIDLQDHQIFDVENTNQ